MQEMIGKSREISHAFFGRKINFYYTSKHFPAISLTGARCALLCKHCKAKLIERLPSAITSSALVDMCKEFERQGAKGVLLTGGCDSQGQVPVSDFSDAIAKIKEETNLKILAHTGIIEYPEAKCLSDSGLDGISFDVVGCVETTREIYGIDITPEDYSRVLRAIKRSGMKNISPHICVGMHNGQLFHEKKALELIRSAIEPTSIVIVGLTNVVGTPLENVRINPEDVIKILCDARFMFPETPVSLGCSRGKGEIRSKIDIMAVNAGVNSIAVPTSQAIAEAKRLGLEIQRFDSCCALLPEQLR